MLGGLSDQDTHPIHEFGSPDPIYEHVSHAGRETLAVYTRGYCRAKGIWPIGLVMDSTWHK